MISLHSIREYLLKSVVAPKIDESDLQTCIDEIRKKLPPPVIWLIGKAQSGKSSIVRTLTGCTDTEIGNGFQACTRSSRIYDFPTSEDCIVRFLDTRGIGEISYNPADDIGKFMNQAHLVMVVVKAMDHAQDDILQTVHMIRKVHPDWPIIVVQTTLHEGYGNSTIEHIAPYPYSAAVWPKSVPDDLARSLLAQRAWLKPYKVLFVAADFTLPEDNLSPIDYGIDALWNAIEEALPVGLQAMLQSSTYGNAIDDIYANVAHRHIVAYALFAAGAEAIPLPLVGIPLVLSLQGKMLHTIASIYRRSVDRKVYAEIVSALGAGYLMRWGGRELIKFVPVYGSAINSVYIAAVTYALGKMLCRYFRMLDSNTMPEHAVIQKIYKEELQKGRNILVRYIGAMSRPPTR